MRIVGNPFLSIVPFVIALSITCSSAQRILSSSNFEHDTQAATGQTTGIWLVRFCSSSALECRELQSAWQKLAQTMLEEQIFLADVDVDSNPQLLKRFERTIQTFPSYILLRNRRMYTKARPDTTIEELENWVRQDWTKELGLEVPPATAPPAILESINKVISIAKLRFDVLVSAAQSKDPSVRLQAQSQLALPILLTCLITVITMYFKITKVEKKEEREKKD